MNKQMNPSALYIALAVLIFAALACNKDEPAVSNSGGTAASTPAAASGTNDIAARRDISGSYAITGTNAGGGGNYGGALAVTHRGEVYQFSWTSGSRKYDGVGVQTDNNVAVAFTEGADGTGCGVVLYKINPDGTLQGKAGYWGTNSAETETATRTRGADLEGEYNVAGTNAAGKNYTGTLSVKQDGAWYRFNWMAGTPISGFGIRTGDKVAAGLGGSQCGFVLYEIKPDGTLDGKWGSSGSKVFGTEVAKKS